MYSGCSGMELDILSSLCNLRIYPLPEGPPPGKLSQLASRSFMKLSLSVSSVFLPPCLPLSMFAFRRMWVLFSDVWRGASITCKVWLLKSVRGFLNVWEVVLWGKDPLSVRKEVQNQQVVTLKAWQVWVFCLFSPAYTVIIAVALNEERLKLHAYPLPMFSFIFCDSKCIILNMNDKLHTWMHWSMDCEDAAVARAAGIFTHQPEQTPAIGGYLSLKTHLQRCQCVLNAM